MFFDADNSREAIKTRMLRVALTYWETKNIDELDPLVKFLTDALSTELYDVINDIKNAEGRILEKIAQLLAPDLLTAPTPAHAVMQAAPAEPFEWITKEDVFYAEKKIALKSDGPADTGVDINFTTISKVKIFDAQLKYIFSGTNLYGYDEASNKMLVASALKGTQASECCIWIGMSCNIRITKINGMSFFFDFKNIEASIADYFYELLPFTKWQMDNREVKVYPGIYDVEKNNKPRKDSDITNDDIMHSIRSNISSYYGRKFVTIADEEFEIKNEIPKIYPEKLK